MLEYAYQIKLITVIPTESDSGVLFCLQLTRNVSMGHGCPRYCQIRINRALILTKGHNSDFLSVDLIHNRT